MSFKVLVNKIIELQSIYYTYKVTLPHELKWVIQNLSVRDFKYIILLRNLLNYVQLQ